MTRGRSKDISGIRCILDVVLSYPMGMYALMGQYSTNLVITIKIVLTVAFIKAFGASMFIISISHVSKPYIDLRVDACRHGF